MKRNITLTLLLALSFMLPYHAEAAYNFITNPGAESGLSGWTSSHTGSSSTSGITNSSGIRVVDERSGSRFFSVRGPSGTNKVTLSQRVDVSAHETVIDAGNGVMTAKAYAFRHDSRDRLYLDVVFYNAVTGGIQLKFLGDEQAPNEKAWELLQHNNETLPNGTRSIEVRLVGTISSSSNILDAYFDDVSLELTVPVMSVDKSSINFGRVYVYDGNNESARTFNDDEKDKTFVITNDGSGNTPLSWNISPPSEVTVSKSSGSIFAGASETLTVSVNPTSTSTFSKTLTIVASNAADESITLSANPRGFPEAVTLTAPAISTNGRVNIRKGDSALFKVSESDPPLYSNSTDIEGYDWQTASGSTSAPGATWDPTQGSENPEKSYTFNQAGDFKVYARMRDSNGVGGTYLEIPVTVWDLPVVQTAPPSAAIPADASELSQSTKVNWLSSQYVGVVGDAIKLQAFSDSDPTSFSQSGLTSNSKVGSGAGSFNNTSGRTVVATDYKGVTDTAPRTITAWIRTTATNVAIVSWGQNSAGKKWTFRLDGSGRIRVEVNGGNTAGNTAVNDNTWRHVAAVLPEMKSPNVTDVLLYVDGVLDNSPPATSSLESIDTASNRDVWIGSDFSNRHFDGRIDDISIFNRALSDTEIEALADSQSVGLTGREDGLVYFNTFDYSGVSKYLWVDSAGTHIATQLPGEIVEVTFGQQNLAGSLSSVAVDNYGIESDEQLFNLKVYPTMTVETGGPYTGKPLTAITLSGSTNTEGYPSAAFKYQWEVDTDGNGIVDTIAVSDSSDPETGYTWSVEGEYAVELTVTVTTQEGVDITTSATDTVTLEAGVPTALHGGPYRGGIAGGNFSPIQLEGNPPGFIEDPEIGEIVAWQWSFGPKESGLTLDGFNDHVEIDAAPLSGLSDWTVMAWVNPDSGSAHQVYSEGSPAITFNFRVQASGAITIATHNGGWDGYTTSGGVVTFGEWNHIAVTLAGGGDVVDSGMLTIYVNGIEAGSGFIQREGAGRQFAAIGENVGSTQGGTQVTLPFKGNIDDVTLFGRALDIAEIQAFLNDSPLGNEAGMLAYWPFEEGSGGTTADVSGNGNNGTLVGEPQFFSAIAEADIYNPTRTYAVAGEYSVGLRVQSEFGKWSPQDTTTITVIDGTIEGQVKAADLRTPVEAVTITLTSSHVEPFALNNVALNNAGINTTAGGSGLSTQTDAEGKYRFPNLPLGSYTLVASKVEGETIHEFETNRQVTELTLDAPNQLAIDYTDLSVFPIGGLIYYSILKNGTDQVYVEDVTVIAQPVGNASPIEAIESTQSLTNDLNYSLPLFAGKYLFLAKRDGHKIRLAGTSPSENITPVGTTHPNYDANSQLVTIEDALKDLDFVDYTTREIQVFVEDGGENPIDMTEGSLILTDPFTDHETDLGAFNPSTGSLAARLLSEADVTLEGATLAAHGANVWRITDGDDVYILKKEGDKLAVYQGIPIEVSIIGDNGQALGPVAFNDSGETVFTTVVPPGLYTIDINVNNAFVKGETSQFEATLDVTANDGDVTMVVPLQIELEIGPAPTLFGATEDFLTDLTGLEAADMPEGFMFYYAPQRQEHTYTITATANGQPVTDFILEIEDDISQETTAPAATVTLSVTNGGNVAAYPVIAGIPNATVVDESQPDTYVETTFVTMDEEGNVTSSTVVKVPKALPKTIKFKARKEGYLPSNDETLEVTVLGDRPEGSVSELVAVPNVNYFVLHDPPGDASYSYLEDSMTIKGLMGGVTMRVKDTTIPVYPSPWSDERQFGNAGNSSAPFIEGGADLDDIKNDDRDIGKRGLLGYRNSDTAGAHYFGAAVAESVIGGITVAAGPFGFALQLVKMGITTGVLANEEFIQYEVSPNRFLRTPSEDEIDDLPDKMGPGKGDLYYGEGWTLGLQTKYRLGIKINPDYDATDPDSSEWIPDTALILTYDILDVNNQYVYTATDIERIIGDLHEQIQLGGTPVPDSNAETKQENLKSARNTWIALLEKNPAYVWRKKYVEGKRLFTEEVGTTEDPNNTIYGDEDSNASSDRAALNAFLESEFPGDDGELLLFRGGTEFDYSRTVAEINTVEFSSEVAVSTEGVFSSEFEAGIDFEFLGFFNKTYIRLGSAVSVSSSQVLDKVRESGTESEQTVGFVLSDGDAWDSFAVRTYEGPWGTPVFFADPGSVSSWPWESGTEKGVDVQLGAPTGSDGPFDYRDGAHYQFTVTSTGRGVKEGSGFPFIFYDLPITNSKSATIKFNGSHADRYRVELFKGFSTDDLFGSANIEERDGIGIASANITVSIYPPERDWDNAGEFEYPVLVQAESEMDYQIAVNKLLRPRFRDLRAPRATVTAPYDGQRISPKVFGSGFEIEVISDDADVAKVTLQRRTVQSDGVFEPWNTISWNDENDDLQELIWEDGIVNPNVTVETPTAPAQRTKYTFTWAEAGISTLGVGEYQIRALAQDAATQLVQTDIDGSGTITSDEQTQVGNPNVDLDPPVIAFRVDASPPSVLTTVPFYQDKESERIFRGELSVNFTDDMNANDFSDRTFEVVDLLDNNTKVAGFVSYSPTLRKTVFVPVIPFNPNGFYKATMKTRAIAFRFLTSCYR
ncbi:MAG: carboxypeptidase regulatory-like domain-containing protein [Candidatus Poribacteria bacterium]|nr:carboxypeptidase regulatory-like domain-containing protein [Candidatus Poribacteria bacterium]